MTRKERTKLERANRRSEMINAAEQLFFSKGYEKVTMDDIVRKAEFSKSTLYAYFKSKEELFLLVHLRGLRKRWAIIKAMEKEKTGLDKLRLFGEKYYKFYKKYPEYLRLQIYWSAYGVNFKKTSRSIINEFKKENEKALNRLKDAFQMELKNSKHPSAANIDRLVSHFLQTLRIVLNQSLFPVDPFHRYNDADYYFQYLDLFMLSIKAMSGIQVSN